MQTFDFGDLQLQIEESPDGYAIYLSDGKDRVRALSLAATKLSIPGKDFFTYNVRVHRDYDDPIQAIQYDLLNPHDRPSVIQLPDGRLFCRKCRCYVPNTANWEMRKEGCFAHSHICGIRAPGEIYTEEED